MRSRRLSLLTVALLAYASLTDAGGVIRGFVDELVIGGFTVPVTFAPLPDGRILVAEKAGAVRVVRDGRVLPDAFVDLRAQVNDYWDRGLLGLAPDPAFAQNGYVYLFYVREDDPLTYSGPKTARVVRVTAAGDEAVPGSEVVLIDGIPADSPSHNGGSLEFGPDGALWITTGDASSFNAVDPRALRAQQLDALAGKLLRVNTSGRGLADNPFWNGDADAVRSKVYAYGFRNPFRLTFRPGTGRPFIADVGANDWEEVNAVARGANHGWPCFEGPAPQPGYQPLPGCQALYAQGPGAVTGPLATYPHATGTASITGGAFYPGTAWPELYRDAYFFGDFSRGSLHYVSIDGADAVAGPIKGFGSGIDGVVDVQADADGVLYLSVTTGELRRVRYVPDTGPLQTIYLSDATSMVTSATNGGGPIELDRSHGALPAGDGGPIALGRETYAKGLGVLAPSDVRVALGGVCTTFTAAAGIDDETKGAGSVTFEVWLDGVRVVASGVVRGGGSPLSGTLDVSGRKELRLVVTDAGDGNIGDHADWAEARFECMRIGGDTVAPVVVVTSPQPAATDVALDAVVSAAFTEDLRASSVGATAFGVEDVLTSTAVAGTVSYDAATRRVILIPQVPWAAGRQYRAIVSAGAGAATDLAGNAVQAGVVWTFTATSPTSNQAPVPVILTPVAGTTFAVGDLLSFTGSATDAEDGPLAPSGLRWTVSVRHCPGGVCHTHPLTTATGSGGSVTAPEHGADSYLIVTLTVTDSGGRSAAVSRDLRPRLVQVTLRTEPPGLAVVFGETRRLSPATFDAVEGSLVTVTTLSPQQSLSLTEWASGRPQQYAVTIGTTNITDTARFAPGPGVSYVSDLAWASATNGAGPVERDRSHGTVAAGDGGPITLRGVTYAKGLGVLASSDIRLWLNGACTGFQAVVGIDDDVQGGGNVVAGVIVDGRLAYVSGAMNGVTPPAMVTVDLTGAKELRLVVVDGGDGAINDEVDWADARLTCSGPGAATPDSPVAVSALSAGQVAGLWWVPVAGAASYRLEAGTAAGASDLGVLDVPSNQVMALTPPGTFWVRVRALNAWGVSAPSRDALLVVTGTTTLPEAPVGVAAAVAGSTVTLSWGQPTTGGLPADYAIEATTDGESFGVVARSAALGFAATSVPSGTYRVRLRAANAAGVSAPTPVFEVVVP